MRGIISYGAYVPYRRLDRTAIRSFLGSGGGRGTRSVASYDEDTTTMAVEASRLALRSAPSGTQPDALWFATVAPAYLDKTNATAIHAALRLDSDVLAADFGGAARSGVAAWRAALEGTGSVLVATADIRTGLPGSADEAAGGDAASALLIGEGGDGDEGGALLAEHLGCASATSEFIDRWRTPGENRSKQWEERFGELQYVPLAEQAWNGALKRAEITTADVDLVAVTGLHSRAVRATLRTLGVAEDRIIDDLSSTVGNSGTAHPGLLLAAALDRAEPGQVIAVLSLADGADAFVFRATDALEARRPARTVAGQVANGADLPYAKFLSWRGMLTLEPPRRPEPARVSASAAARSTAWKYAFVGSRDRTSGAVHLPPARVSMVGDAVDDMEPIPMADTEGTIVTYTVDRLAYSPSPPVIFAVVDFDGGGRLPIELTDIDETDVAIGGRVEMTFRRLNTADGIHNYFWKARPVRG
ncbi:MAG: OB-fold domain-containing protein [Acidimicrobiales bacterium]